MTPVAVGSSGGYEPGAALRRAVATLEPGDHVCCWYDDDVARDRAVTGYVANGLRRQQKVAYLTGVVPVRGVLADGGASALCLYDNRTITPQRRRQLVAAHPASLDAARADRWTPLLRMSRVPSGLRLVGEVDVSNRRSLATLLEQVCAEVPPGEPVTVDVTGLRFVDAATGRLFARAAAARPGGLSLAGATPLLARLTDPDGGGAAR